MEFNNKTLITKPATTSNGVVAANIKLTSPSRVGTSSMKDAITIDTKLSSNNSVLVSHDVRDLKAKYDKDLIKSSLVTVYGKNSRLEMSSKDVETLDIPISEFPARLEYSFTVLENNIPIEYKVDYLIPTQSTSSLVSLQGVREASISEVTPNAALSILDEEITNLKKNMQDFASIYDNSQKKVVSLQQFLTNLSTQVDNLSQMFENDRKKS